MEIQSDAMVSANDLIINPSSEGLNKKENKMKKLTTTKESRNEMNKYEKLEQAIKETSNPQITIAQTLLGEDQDCYIKTKVTGLNINGDKATYIHMNDDFEGADLSEVAGFEVDIPQIKELKLSDAVDWFFFDESKFLGEFCLTKLAKNAGW